jgi:GAF domain-containing protein
MSDRAERETAESASAVYERITDAVFALDSEWRVTYLNDRAARALDVEEEAVLGRSVWAELTEPARVAFKDNCLDAVASGTPVQFEQPFPTDDDRRSVRIYPDEGGVTVCFRKVEADPRQDDRSRREWAMQEAYETIASDREFDETVQRLLEIGSNALDTGYGTLSNVEGDEYLFDTVVTPEGADLEAGDVVDVGATNCERVMETEETLVLNNIEEEAPELATRTGNAEWGLNCYVGTALVVDGEVTGTFCFYDMEARTEAFADWQVAFVEYLGQWVEQELERMRYLDRLSALNDLNTVVREITDAAIDQSTREEIERRVCEALAATSSYQFAWIGEPNPQTQEVELRAECGVEGYLDETTISTDPDAAESQGPTGMALRTGEVQRVQRVTRQAEYEPWQDHVEKHGYRSSAAIPIEYEGTSYGVLNLYTERPDGFEEEESAVVGLLGTIVGHANAAADRKQALLSDSLVELELRAAGAVTELDVDGEPGEPVVLEAAVPRGDDEYVVFGSAEPDDLAFVEELVDAQPHWLEFLHVESLEDQLSFGILLGDPPLMSTLASVGGRLVEAVIGESDLRIRFQLPHTADVSQTIDAVREAYPNTSLVSKQETTAQRTTGRGGPSIPFEKLTARQLEALRTAYHAGYFDWPRAASGEEVAEMLDITSATFSQHLRSAERAVFESLLDEERV